MIDFLRYRVAALGLFGAMIIGFLGVAAYKWHTTGSVFTYSVDFTGGLQAIVRSSQDVASDVAGKALEATGMRPVVRSIGTRELLIRIPQGIDQAADISKSIVSALEASVPGVSFQVVQLDSVGASIGEGMWLNMLKAFFVCIGVILLYILSRFLTLGYAVGAIGALLHDALVIGIVCMVGGYEVSPEIMLAMLIILGYSINDTIIIFSRIRENRAHLPSRSLHEVVNISCNETMRRTMLTTLSTLLGVVPFLLVGGAHFRTSSIMLLIGFIFGTYSSIFVASPIMMLCTQKRI